MAKWLLKSEPDCYGWSHLLAEGEGTWDGVRNHQAGNNLKAMTVGDEALFYHSGPGAAAVGLVVISASAFPDPTDASGKWMAVKVKPLRALPKPVTLKAMRDHPDLADMAIIRQSRLSVAPVSGAEWAAILAMGGG